MQSGSPDAVNFESDAERFHLLVDAVTDYAIYMLDPAGHVASWNSGAERLKGYSATEIIGQPYGGSSRRRISSADLPAKILTKTTDTDAMRSKAGECARTARASSPRR